MSRRGNGKGTSGKGSEQPETTHDQKDGRCPFLRSVKFRNGATFTGCGLVYLLLNAEGLESEPAIEEYRELLTQAVGGYRPFQLLERREAYPCPGYNPSDGSFTSNRAARYCPLYVGKNDDGRVVVSERMENVLKGIRGAYERRVSWIRAQYEQLKIQAKTLGIELT